jgi:hypothetical protein
MRVWARRPIAVVLLAQSLTGCMHSWKTPKPPPAPEAFVAAKHPGRVLVTTRSGEKVQLREPIVTGDSLAEGPRFQHTVWEDQPAAVSRPAATDITVVKADGDRIRIVRLTTTAGDLEVRDPTLTDDSVFGTARVPRVVNGGIPLRDITQLKVRSTNVYAVVAVSLVGIAGLVGSIALMKVANDLP